MPPMTTPRSERVAGEHRDDASGTRWRFDGYAFELHPLRGRGLLPQPHRAGAEGLRDVAHARGRAAMPPVLSR